MAVPCPFTNLIVGINGTLTTAHRRLDKFPFPATNALVVAPAFATNGLIPGVSEFWFTTNAAAARYVWHNVAFNRSSSNLVSFAATYCRNRDLIFEYGPAFTSNVLSLIQNGTNLLVLSASDEMQLRFNQGFTNVPPFSYLCPSVFICGSGASCGALAEHCSNRSFRFSFIADLGDGTGDLDADGVSNYNEVMRYGTDPRSADTDQDGLADGAELAAGTDPRSFDTDSDGLADSVDPSPLVSDGTCFGQGTNWVAAAYGTNAPAILAQGYENYVQNTVTNDGNGWWYSFTVTVSNFDDFGHALVRVGDQAVVLARPAASLMFLAAAAAAAPVSASATFLLKRGKEYGLHVTPDQAFGLAAAPSNDSYPSVTWLNGSGFVIWPPSLDLTPADCHFGAITHIWQQAFTATIRDCHPDLVSARLWSSGRGYVSIATSPNGPATVAWTNIVEGTLTDTLYCDALIDGHLWRGSAALFYETPEGALPHVELAAADTIFCNDDDDNANGTNDYADTAFITGEDDDLIPVTVSFKSDIPTNADLRLSVPSGGLRLWRTRNHAEELTPPLLWENVSAPTSMTVYAERASGDYSGVDAISFRADWLTGGRVAGSVTSVLTAVEPVAEPICNEWKTANGTNYVYNPCCLVRGQDSWFKVSVKPDGYPDEKIVWSAADGDVSFVNGSIGREVCVRPAGDTQAVILGVRCGTCPSPEPHFVTIVRSPIVINLYPYFIYSDDILMLPSEQRLQQRITKANEIWRQIGISFALQPVIPIYDGRFDDVNRHNAKLRNSLISMTDAYDGIAIVCVRRTGVDLAFAPRGGHHVILGLERGLTTIAHELGHCFGLKDIYVEQYEKAGSRKLLKVDGITSQRRCSSVDWNNGTGARYYAAGTTQSALIQRLIMFGTSSGERADITRSVFEGITYTNAELNVYNLEMVPVGLSNALSHLPGETDQ